MNAERPLAGRVALVTGASRGAGRGIAIELGAAGATVYLSARSTRAAAPDVYPGLLAPSGLARAPGSIEDTAAAVEAAGGRAIAIACDHGDEAQVTALFARIAAEAGQLDLLVNNVWGGHESFGGPMQAPFWEQPMAHWDSMFNQGVRLQLIAARHAVPLLGAGSLIVTTSFWDRDRYLQGNLFYDLAKASLCRLAFGLAEELRERGVASLALSPGWMRTEWVMAGHGGLDADWRQRPELARTESPRYLGRAVVAIAADPARMRLSGRSLRVGDLARDYGFTDIDGRQPPAFEL